jgi:hypothetical protein
VAESAIVSAVRRINVNVRNTSRKREEFTPQRIHMSGRRRTVATARIISNLKGRPCNNILVDVANELLYHELDWRARRIESLFEALVLGPESRESRSPATYRGTVIRHPRIERPPVAIVEVRRQKANEIPSKAQRTST